MLFRSYNLIDTTRMEKIAIEMVRGPVIAQIQSHHVVAFGIQMGRGREHVLRFCTALPSMQQHHNVPWRFPTRGPVGEQPHSLSTMKKQFATCGHNRRRA